MMVSSVPEPPPRNMPQFSLYFDEWGQLVFVDGEGRRHEGARVMRAFPITDPEHFASVVGPDGHELALIHELGDLSPQMRGIVAAELARREFLPQIRRIKRVSGRIEPCEWLVDTDRGPHRFVLKAYEDVHRLGPHRALIIGGEGIRFLIPDTRALDKVSRSHMERYL